MQDKHRFRLFNSNAVRWLWVMVLSAVLTACGGGGGGGGTTGVAPSITTQPVSVTANAGATASFTVVATGGAPLSYQWRKGTTDIAGANAESYTTPSLTALDNNTGYSVVVSNSAGSVTSNQATLTVHSPPSIQTQPASQTVNVGDVATFSVTATGTAPLSYQWRRDGNVIGGATSASYTTPILSLADTGASFSVHVSNTLATVNSEAATLTVNAAAGRTGLVISEVSTCYYSNIGCWLEVFNPTANAIDLANHQLKSLAINTGGGFTFIQTFSLPSVSVPAGSYVVIAGNTNGLIQRGSQLVPIAVGNTVPFWNTNGFVELLDATGTTTVDFVRFGASTQSPVTAAAWSGASASAVPSNSSTDYGQSIARAHTQIATVDQNTAADWSVRNWATPGGRNDVPGGTLDSDNDGIPDSAEAVGGTYAGLDLYAMGARTGQRDIFIEVDHMDSSDPGVIPRQEALAKVVESFAAQNIRVHIDAGTQFSNTFSTTLFNLGQGDNKVPYEPCVTFNSNTCSLNSSSRRTVWDWKQEHSDIRRRGVFHYALFGNSQRADGTSGSSGLAELSGNDLLMTMGGWGFVTTPGTDLNRLINMQASTFMHELGHNLNLLHGGNEDTNYKPNYWSVMNYTYQLMGLDADPTASSAYLRWRMEYQGDVSQCGLPNSPCGDPSQFVMSFSNGTSGSLNENSLIEWNNVGRGGSSSRYADWNLNSTADPTAISVDLNLDGSRSVLTDHDDWGNLVLVFSRNASGNSGKSRTSAKTAAPAFNPVTADRQPIAPACAPISPGLKALLARAQKARR